MDDRKDGFCRKGGSKKFDKKGNLIEVDNKPVSKKPAPITEKTPKAEDK